MVTAMYSVKDGLMRLISTNSSDNEMDINSPNNNGLLKDNFFMSSPKSSDERRINLSTNEPVMYSTFMIKAAPRSWKILMDPAVESKVDFPTQVMARRRSCPAFGEQQAIKKARMSKLPLINEQQQKEFTFVMDKYSGLSDSVPMPTPKQRRQSKSATPNNAPHTNGNNFLFHQTEFDSQTLRPIEKPISRSNSVTKGQIEEAAAILLGLQEMDGVKSR